MMRKPRIKDLFSPENGPFTYIPNDIWGDLYDVDDLNLEFYLRYGNLYASTLSKHYLDNDDPDMERLSMHIYRKFKRQWQMEFTALNEDYNMFLTGRLMEDREYTRLENVEGSNNEVSTRLGSREESTTSINRDTKSGEIVHTTSLEDTFNTTDTLEKGTKVDSVLGGVDSTTLTSTTSGNMATTGADDVINTGTNTSSSNEVLAKRGEETTSKDEASTSGETSTLTNDSESESNKDNTGTQSNVLLNTVYAFDSTVATNQSGSKDDRTDNLKEKVGTTSNSASTNNSDTETTLSGSDKLTFTDREDERNTENSETLNTSQKTSYGKIEDTTGSRNDTNAVSYGRTDSIAQSGSDTASKTGTISKGGEDVTSYNEYEEMRSGDEQLESTDSSNTSTDGEHTQQREVTYSETLKREADSPLQTTQQLIWEELAVRKVSYSDLIMEAIRSVTALSVWRR